MINDKPIMESLKRITSIILRVSISMVLLIFLFRQVDKKGLLEIIQNADTGLLLLAFIIFFFSYILAIFRWEILLKTVKIHLPLKRIIISFAGGIFFSLFLPSTIGGDLMRSIDLATHTKRPREVVATVLLDRLSGYVGLVVVALLALLFGWRFVQDSSVLLSLAIITALLIAVLLVLFNKFLYSKVNALLHSTNLATQTSPSHIRPGQSHSQTTVDKIRESLKNLHQEIHIFRHHKKVILNNLLLSVLIQTIFPLTFYVIALSLGIKINIIYFFVFLPIIAAITLLPISIGGLGLRDATTVFFFAKAGVSKDLSFAMSLILFSFILANSILGGLIYVLTVRHRRIQRHQSPLIRKADH